MIVVVAVIVVIVLCSVYFYKKWVKYLCSIKVKSNIDGKYYTVRNTEFSQQSADTLAIINKRVNILLNHLRSQKNIKLQNNVDLLLKRYNNSLMENIELDSTTYTTNKGQEIAVCLMPREGENIKIYDINNLMFVVVHELTHIGCESRGHNQEFRIFFEYLLEQAIDCGIYIFTDYNVSPIEYCGITISSTI